MLASSGVSWLDPLQPADLRDHVGASGAAVPVRARYASHRLDADLERRLAGGQEVGHRSAVPAFPVTGMTPALTWSARVAVGKETRTCAASSSA